MARILAFVRLLLLGLALSAPAPAAALARELTVFAAASLKEALDALAQDFETKAQAEVTISYAGSSALARQISHGAPADVFISANAAWMDQLERDNLILRETRFDLASNRLVLVSPAGAASPIDLTDRAALPAALGNGRLAMALVDAVPAGIYGRTALEALGLWDQVAPQVAQTDNVRAALALVTLGAAQLGVVYATDARAEPRVTVRAVFPEDSHPVIRYSAAVTRSATGPLAKAFLDHLRQPSSFDILRQQGFVVPVE